MFNLGSLCSCSATFSMHTFIKEIHLLLTCCLLYCSFAFPPTSLLPPSSPSLPPPPYLHPTYRVQSQRVLASPWVPSEARLQRLPVQTPSVLSRGRPVPRRFLSTLRVPNAPPPQPPPCMTSLTSSQTLTLQIIIVDFIIETNTADCMQMNDSIRWCNLFLTLLTQQCKFDSH